MENQMRQLSLEDQECHPHCPGLAGGRDRCRIHAAVRMPHVTHRRALTGEETFSSTRRHRSRDRPPSHPNDSIANRQIDSRSIRGTSTLTGADYSDTLLDRRINRHRSEIKQQSSFNTRGAEGTPTSGTEDTLAPLWNIVVEHRNEALASKNKVALLEDRVKGLEEVQEKYLKKIEGLEKSVGLLMEDRQERQRWKRGGNRNDDKPFDGYERETALSRGDEQESHRSGMHHVGKASFYEERQNYELRTVTHYHGEAYRDQTPDGSRRSSVFNAEGAGYHGDDYQCGNEDFGERELQKRSGSFFRDVRVNRSRRSGRRGSSSRGRRTSGGRGYQQERHDSSRTLYNGPVNPADNAQSSYGHHYG